MTLTASNSNGDSTLLRYCFHIASRQSLIVTPFLFRVVTVRPVENFKSSLIMGGVVAIFFNISGSWRVAGEVLIFL